MAAAAAGEGKCADNPSDRPQIESFDSFENSCLQFSSTRPDNGFWNGNRTVRNDRVPRHRHGRAFLPRPSTATSHSVGLMPLWLPSFCFSHSLDNALETVLKIVAHRMDLPMPGLKKHESAGKSCCSGWWFSHPLATSWRQTTGVARTRPSSALLGVVGLCRLLSWGKAGFCLNLSSTSGFRDVAAQFNSTGCVITYPTALLVVLFALRVASPFGDPIAKQRSARNDDLLVHQQFC